MMSYLRQHQVLNGPMIKKMDVFDTGEGTKPNGADFVEFKEIYKKVPCRVSVRNLVNTEQNEAHQTQDRTQDFLFA